MGLEHQPVQLSDRIRQVAADERPRHVRPAPRGLVLRPQVDADRRVRGQRARAGLVPDVVAGAHRRDDDVLGRGRAGTCADLAHVATHRLRRQHLAAVPQLVTVDVSLAQQARRLRHPRQGGVRSAPDPGHLGAALPPPA